MKRILLVTLLMVAAGASAEIYKWVDENGVTHYGSRKPVNTKVEQMDVESGEARQVGSEPKQLSGEAKEMADSFAEEILRDKGDAPEVDCEKAVFNAKDSIDTMLSVGKKNYEGGYIQEAEYKKMSEGLKKIQRKISMSECAGATGDVKGFYKCMSNDYNHVASCGKKYNYGT